MNVAPSHVSVVVGEIRQSVTECLALALRLAEQDPAASDRWRQMASYYQRAVEEMNRCEGPPMEFPPES